MYKFAVFSGIRFKLLKIIINDVRIMDIFVICQRIFDPIVLVDCLIKIA